MARPKKDISEEQVSELAQLGLSGEEIASVLKCSRDLLYKRFSTAIKDGHEHRNSSLRRKQFELAMAGNATMLIWLGKQYLAQSEKQELTGKDGESLAGIAVTFVKANES